VLLLSLLNLYTVADDPLCPWAVGDRDRRRRRTAARVGL